MKVNAFLEFLQAAGVVNFRVEKVALIPAYTPGYDDGRLLYHTASHTFYYGKNGVWVEIGSAYAAGDAIEILTNVISVMVDDSSVEVADPGGYLQIKANGIIDSHLSDGAKQGTLESKIVPGWDQILWEGMIGVGVHKRDVSASVNSVASVPLGVNSETTLGVFLGHMDYSRLPIRDSNTRQEILYQGETIIFGRLTNISPGNPANITGVTSEFAGPDAESGLDGTLRFTFASQSLSWDGGPAVYIPANGLYKLNGINYGVKPGNYLTVRVVKGALPGSDQSDVIPFGAGIPPGNKIIGFYTYIDDAEIPVDIATTVPVSIDFMFIENFNLYTRPNSAVLNGVAFGEMADPLITHNHDDRYFTKTQFGSILLPNDGASLVGFDPASRNYITGDSVGEALRDLDSAMVNKADAYTAPFVALSTWNVNHNLGTQTVLVQIYDATNKLIIPDSVTLVDNNNLTVVFSEVQTGKVVVIGV